MVQLEQQGWKINHCPTTVRLMAHQSETQGIRSIYKTRTFCSKSANAISSPSDGETAAPVTLDSQGSQASTTSEARLALRAPAILRDPESFRYPQAGLALGFLLSLKATCAITLWECISTRISLRFSKMPISSFLSFPFAFPFSFFPSF